MTTNNNLTPMQQALQLAQIAANNGEVPVGAVVVHDGEVIVKVANQMKALNDPTAHAEMLAIKQALALVGTGRLAQCDLYVTLEPCTMCAGAIAHAKLRRVYYGADDPKGGAVDNGVRFFNQPTCHHQPEVIAGLNERESAKLLQQFFLDRR
ncbi:nucleoside deaminase [Maritalea porphyrae]|uniref:nucleoside deaminase n=1 Tax=Maritalea porphyrae TaxID=880732 RepID=UPI0022AF4826|nr:nucleoside deaminase [Maritalea porphyrae]MCZ4271428.1 nucleoside deaminase [Maritalea porphyrae]